MDFASFRCVRSSLLFAGLSLTSSLFAQAPQPAVRGTVTDPSGSSVPGAVVNLRGPGGYNGRKATDEKGQYEFRPLLPGKYQMRITKAGFTVFNKQDINVDNPVSVDVALSLAMEAQSVTVEDSNNTVSVDASSNASALVLKGADLDMLSDDPDDLAADLQALAGPSAGPNGGQIFIDGFSGGQLPPKASIREIRINQNPFSAEYDRLGFGRIEILTKPGTDKFRGQAFFNFSDKVLNSRNPFIAERPPYQQRGYGLNFSGPINKKSSFSFDAERREIDENSLVNATILDPTTFAISPLQTAIISPQRRTSLGPRFDYQLSQNNTLVVRYHFVDISNDNQGVGQFSLGSRAYNSVSRDHTLQITETAVLNAHAIHETRFQYLRAHDAQDGNTTIPTVSVLDAFTGGGSQVGLASTTTNRYELQDLTTITHNAHAFKFGGRLRAVKSADISPNNFGGTFTFTGNPAAPQLDSSFNVVPGATVALTSIQVYQRAQMLLKAGFTPQQVAALGAGANQFSISGGNPLAGVTQYDVGVFFTDDYRLKPNFTLSYGLRYETQTNIGDYRDFAPRIGFAWGVGGGKNKQAKTVIRGGAGIFYDRFSENYTLQALRFNGITQQQYIVRKPDFYPIAKKPEELGANRVPVSIREVDNHLRAPYIAQSAIGVDRQLPKNITMSVTYTFSRSVHMFRQRNINTPLADGTRPYGDAGNLFLFESSGFSRQNQLMTNINARASRKITLFGFYVLNHAKSDTDGINTQPANPYNLHTEYSNAQFDVRHRMFIGGQVQAPKKVSFNPFITASSGAPFNITTGLDPYGTSVFTARPSFATPGTPGAIGIFNPNPGPNDTLIPRNFGRGPGQFSVNLRVSRTWGFGPKRGGEVANGPFGGPEGGGPGGPGGDHGGRGGPGGGGRGPGGMGPGGMGGMRGGMGGGGMRGGGGTTTDRRFNLTLSASARNLLNHVNLAAPNGNLSSALFGQSLSTAGGFGPGGGSAAGNRRLELMLRLSF